MKYNVPKECFERSNLKLVVFLVYSSLLWIGPILFLGWWWSQDHSLLAKAIPVFFLGPIAGYGMYLGGFIGHDGFHFTLHENKMVSCLLGIAFSCFKTPFMITGFALTHWNHHRYLASDRDPDVQIFSRFKNLASRILMARPHAFAVYAYNCFRIALGVYDKSDFNHPISYNKMRLLGTINILATAIALSTYLYLLFNHPLYFWAFMTMNVFGLVISGLGPYLEHAGTVHDQKSRATRSIGGLWWDVFYLGNNYHIEHHLYPTIPFYNLKKAHLALKAQGYYDESRPYTEGVISPYKYALGKYEYS